MTARFISPLIVAGSATALAIALAPAAAASSNDMSCDTRGGASVCQKSGHSSIHASPDSSRKGSVSWPFGVGPMPPVWAIG